jgi:streptogramin lyase
MLLPANVVEYFRVTPGHKISGIQRTASGNLYVTEMTK